MIERSDFAEFLMNSQWQLQPIFGSYLLTVGLACVLLLLLMVNPSFGQLSPSRRRILTLLRGGIVLLVLLAMLRPTWIRTERRTQTSHLLLICDTSRSMLHRDVDEGKSRWEKQRSMLRSAQSQLGNMGDQFQVELFGFNRAIERLGKWSATRSAGG